MEGLMLDVVFKIIIGQISLIPKTNFKGLVRGVAKYIAGQNKYLQLKKLQKGGLNFFVKMDNKKTQMFDTEEDKINNTDDLIEKIIEINDDKKITVRRLVSYN